MVEKVVDKVDSISEEKVIHTIVTGSDWQDVLTNLIAEEGMDPLKVDIIQLASAFMNYLQRLKSFDFRIPARFILIAAILLRMKAELLLEEERERQREKQEKPPKIDIENVPQLLPPMLRKTTRKVTLNELVTALQKAFDFKDRKEERKLRLKRRVENLIEGEEDIELRIKIIYDSIVKKNETTFSALVPVWRRHEIVETFLPVLYLSNRGKISCSQEEFFKEIYIKLC
jgi:segregation and condensation protein A